MVVVGLRIYIYLTSFPSPFSTYTCLVELEREVIEGCVGVSAHAHFGSDIALSSPLQFHSTCNDTIFLIVGGGRGISYLKIYYFSSFLYQSFYIFSLWVIFSCTCPCHSFCFVVYLCVLLSLPLVVPEDRQVHTLHHIHLHLWHAPSYNTNVTCIRRNFHSPLNFFLALVGIPTNYWVIISINFNAETMHGENI